MIKNAIYHQESASLLTLVFSEQINGIIAEQNLIELYRVLTNSKAMKDLPLTSKQASELIINVYLNSNKFKIVYPNNSVLHHILTIATNHNITSAKIFDMRLAALILDNDIDYFTTYNIKDFNLIEGLNPLTPQQILDLI
jgi:predicted nucleic acid-binding protein